MKGFARRRMNLRNRCAGRGCKPPYGALAKIQGVERLGKRRCKASGVNNGDERK